MRNKFDNFLLGILWLILSTLGLCFWFNIQFGFNIFSRTHWQHLAYMQATQTQIRPLFYASVIIGLFCIIFGLYILIRPRFRKIKLPQQETTNTPPTAPVAPQPAPDMFALTRPNRINGVISSPADTSTQIEILTAPVAGMPPTQTPSAQQFAPPAQTEQDSTELQEIFESAGYTIKKSPRVKGYTIPLFAIGANETIWIGATQIETSTLQSIIDSFNQIFSDTLEDITIEIHGFVINASDAESPAAPEILTFATLDDLRAYIAQNPNPPLDPDMQENFDAFSGYISTVIDYIGHQ